MKIKFLAFNNDDCGNKYAVNPIYFFLKSFYKKNGSHYEKYIWLDTEYILESIDDTVKKIVNEKPDILCLSMFLWNFSVQAEISKRVKQIIPNIIIIVGGPEIDKDINKDFFQTFDFIDYAVIGQGEVAFSSLLDSFYDNTIDKTAISNLVTQNYKNKYVPVKYQDYPLFNPFLDLPEDTIDVINYFIERGKTPFLGYEIVRGCPYRCSFCNWQGGLDYKVYKRNQNTIDEITFIAKNKGSIYVTDANFGMTANELTIADAIVDLSKTFDTFKFNIDNMAKLNKNRVFEIHDKFSSSIPDYTLKISLQSLNNKVLEAIDRPEIPWEDHKKLIVNHKEKYNSFIKAEIIYGLPLETIENVENQLIEFSKIPLDLVIGYEWILLKNSPAYNTDYKTKHNLIDQNIIFLGYTNSTLYDTAEILTNKEYYKQTLIFNKDFGIKGLIYSLFIEELYKHDHKNFEKNLNNYRNWMSDLSEDIYNNMMLYQHTDNNVSYIIWGYTENNVSLALRKHIKNLIENIFKS